MSRPSFIIPRLGLEGVVSAVPPGQAATSTRSSISWDRRVSFQWQQQQHEAASRSTPLTPWDSDSGRSSRNPGMDKVGQKMMEEESLSETTNTLQQRIDKCGIIEELRNAVIYGILFKYNEDPNIDDEPVEEEEEEVKKKGKKRNKKAKGKEIRTGVVPLRFLPENPFFDLCRFLSPMEQKHLWSDVTDDQVFQKIQNEIDDQTEKYFEIHMANDPDNSEMIIVQALDRNAAHIEFWGQPNLLQFIDPKSGARTGNFLLTELVCTHPENLEIDKLYSVNIIPSMAGPYLFYKHLLPQPREFVMTEDFVIKGPKLEDAMNVFIQFVASDLLRMQKSKKFVSIIVAFVHMVDHEIKVVKMWNLEDIKQKRKMFKSEMKDAIIQKQKITSKSLVRFDSFPSIEDPNIFELEKYYSFSWIDSEKEDEKAKIFKAHPLETIYFGIFLTREHAEAYFQLVDNVLSVQEKLDYLSQNEEYLKKEVKRLYLKGTPVDWAYPYLLYCIHSNFLDPLPDIYRLSNAVETKIAEFTRTLRHLQFMIKQFKLQEVGEISWYLNPTREQFPYLRQRIIEVFDSNEHSYLIPMIKPIERILDEITDTNTGKLVLDADVTAQLSLLEHFCYVVAKSIAEETLMNATELRNDLMNLVLPDPDEDPEYVDTIFNHEYIEEVVVDVTSEMHKLRSKGRVPTHMINEGVILHYISSIGIYRLVYDCLKMLVLADHSDKDGQHNRHISTPFPEVMRRLQGASLEKSFFVSSDPDDEKPTQLLRQTNARYGISEMRSDEEFRAFGLESALFSLNNEKLDILSEFTAKIFNRSRISAGSYQLSVANTVSTTDFTMGTRLSKLKIHQHYHIEGPRLQNAVDIFCNDLIKYFTSLCLNRDLLIDGLTLNDHSIRSKIITYESLQAHKSECTSNIKESILASHPFITIKGFAVYMFKYYIPMSVDVHFHFHDSEKHKSFSFQNQNALSLFTNVFESEKDAIQMLNIVGVFNNNPHNDKKLLNGITAHIIEEMESNLNMGDIIELYRWIMLYCKIHKDTEEKLLAKVGAIMGSKVGELFWFQNVIITALGLLRKWTPRQNSDVIRQTLSQFSEFMSSFIRSTGCLMFQGVQSDIDAGLHIIQRLLEEQPEGKFVCTASDIDKLMAVSDYIKCSYLGNLNALHNHVLRDDVKEFLARVKRKKEDSERLM